MNTLQVQQLKKGYGINHPVHGYLQYRGLVTKNPFTEEPKIPYQYLFWKGVDEHGKNQPDVVLMNGSEEFEVVDENEETND